MMRPLKILTWHVHGNYLWYLSHCGHQFYLPVRHGTPGYGGRGDTFPLGDNVHDVPANEVRRLQFDCILYQHRKHYLEDRHRLLSPEQRQLPCIYLEHDPPLEVPTGQHHWFEEANGLLVHVTPFNALMWDSSGVASKVIEHGVPYYPDRQCHGELPRGLTAVNHLGTRGPRLGGDVFLAARRQVPIDLVGLGSESLGGLGEVKPTKLAAFAQAYRFFFHPIRYTSLGLAVCEAMMLGMPVVGLATTEMATVIQNGVTGYVDTSLERLIPSMRRLVVDRQEALRLGQNARRYAQERFSMRRFVDDWNKTFAVVVGMGPRAGRSDYVASDCAYQ